VRFTRRADEDTIYALFMGELAGGPVTITDLRVARTAMARDVATDEPIALRQDGDGLTLTLRSPAPDTPVHAVAIDHAS
jgi:hypothetical protein